MTPEDKQLLLKDLSARLPYGVKIKLGDYDYQVCGYNSENPLPLKIWYYYKNNSKSLIDVYLTDYRPYLRPMSSMTELEKSVLSLYNAFIEPRSIELKIDFYNKQHFDYRGLIEKGLAIKAPEGMYD